MSRQIIPAGEPAPPFNSDDYLDALIALESAFSELHGRTLSPDIDEQNAGELAISLLLRVQDRIGDRMDTAPTFEAKCPVCRTDEHMYLTRSGVVVCGRPLCELYDVN